MTLEEIDRELMRLPASPTTPEDIEARADLTLKRFEAIAAAREAEACRAAAERKQAWGLPLANVPPGVDCVITGNGRTVFAEIADDGRRVMRLTAGELRALAINNHLWTELNPELVT